MKSLNHAADENSCATDEQERAALIRDIGRRLKDMNVEQLRRIDWHMDRITRE